MGTEAKDRKWVVVRIDGKIAAISSDYKALAHIASRLACSPDSRLSAKNSNNKPDRFKGQQDKAKGLYNKVIAETVGFDEVWKLRKESRWEDFLLFGSDFQKKVWHRLWELTHLPQGEDKERPQLISYSDFAELCENRSGVRAVAHAIGLNPISIVIPCHLVIPKEAIDKIYMIQKKAEATIFKGEDLCLKSILNDSSIDFGEYSLGRRLKRELISMELSR